MRAGRPRCLPGQLWALLPVRAAGAAPGPAGSCRFPLCLSRSLLSPPLQPLLSSTIAPLLLLFPHSSFAPLPPPPPAFRSNRPSRAPPLRRVPCGAESSPPRFPRPRPGSFMPRPGGRVPSGLHIPCPGRAGLGWASSSSCLHRDPPHRSLSPRALSQPGGALGATRGRGTPHPPPFTSSRCQDRRGLQPGGVQPSNPAWMGTARGGTSRGGQLGGVQPRRGFSSERGRDGYRASQRATFWRGPALQGHVPEGFSYEG